MAPTKDEEKEMQTPLITVTELPAEPTQAEVIFAMVYFAICSGTLLVINKVTIEVVRAPVFILICQLSFSSFAVKLGDSAGLIKSEPLELRKVLAFSLVVLGFVACLFCNIKTLQYTNVETFITFRSSTPIPLSLCDYFFLNRHLPSARSWASLTAILAGAAGYVSFDSSFQVQAYMWLGLWYLAFLFDTVYIKHVCNTIPMTDWGRVYYTNLLSLLPLLPAWLALREYELLQHTDWSVPTITILAVSCLVGLCMSHAAYMLRRVVSATAMALVGIVCKVLTVIINFLIWDKHASLEGIGCLLVCVLAGSAYEQAPMRAAAPKPAPAPAAAADSSAAASVVDAKAIVLEGLKGEAGGPGAASYRVTASGRATNTGASPTV